MSNNNKFRSNEGDWVCSDAACGNVNFARRTSCNKCNKEKESVPKKKLGQEIGKAAAEKSKGLFSADDWVCSRCYNINWARRPQCNMCNAPKFGENEERTGYGGGYNDRGVVEYVKREESDDEYDEFGRRKKGRSRSESKKDDDEKSDEDEEEEEDDDEDLSKYDLTEWDDLAPSNSDSEQKQRDIKERSENREKRDKPKRARSRSRSPN